MQVRIHLQGKSTQFANNCNKLKLKLLLGVAICNLTKLNYVCTKYAFLSSYNIGIA